LNERNERIAMEIVTSMELIDIPKALNLSIRYHEIHESN
jgi:hypothetical protein